MHQRFHRYVPHHYFLSGVDNGISDLPYRLRDIRDANLLSHMEASHPQKLTWRMWTPTSALVSTLASALQHKTLPMDSLLVEMPPPMGTGKCRIISVKTWTSTPYSSCTGIRCLFSTPLQGSTGQETSPPADVRYDTARLRKLSG